MTKLVIANFGEFHLRALKGVFNPGCKVIFITNVFQGKSNNRLGNAESTAWLSLICDQIVLRVLRRLGIKSSTFSQFSHTLFDLEIALRLWITRPDVFVGLSGYSLFSVKVALKYDIRSVVSHGSCFPEWDIDLLQSRFGDSANSIIPQRWIIERQTQEFALADKIHVFSHHQVATFQSYSTIHPNKFIIFPLIFLDDFWTAENRARDERHKNLIEPLNFMYVGSCDHRKNLIFAVGILNALSDILQKKIVFNVIGPITSNYRTVLIDQGNSSVSVRCSGPLKKQVIAQRMHKVDYFLFPSLSDGFGNAVVEAIASGVTPIVSNNAGVAEYIEKADVGVVFDVSSTPAQIAEQISTHMLSKNPIHCRQKIFKNVFDGYSLEKFISQLR